MTSSVLWEDGWTAAVGRGGPGAGETEVPFARGLGWLVDPVLLSMKRFSQGNAVPATLLESRTLATPEPPKERTVY